MAARDIYCQALDKSSLPKPITSAVSYSSTSDQQHKENALDPPSYMYLRNIGWWWEIGALLLSIVCTAFIVAVLLIVNNQPLQNWTLPIQPNSLIAALSTIAKSALLVPVSSCLSQLKWLYFKEPRVLSRLQAYDDASRGPWGAMVLLWKTRSTSIVTNLAALLVIFLLAFQPFTQQMIEFSTLQAPISNTTGFLTQAGDSLFLRRDALLNMRIPSTMTQIVNTFLSQVSGLAAVQNFGCPSSSCSVPAFTTLATCSSCKQLNILNNTTCQFRNALDERIGNSTEEFKSYLNQTDAAKQYLAFSDWTANCTIFYNSSGIAFTNLNFSIDPLIGDNRLQFVTQPGDATVPPLGDVYDPTAMGQFLGFKLGAPLPEKSLESVMNWEGIRGNLTGCSIQLCARQYGKSMMIENNQWINTTGALRSKEVLLELSIVGGSEADIYQEKGSTGAQYFITLEAQLALKGVLEALNQRMLVVGDPRGGIRKDQLDSYLWNTPWELIASSMSAVSTSIINSWHNENSTNMTLTAQAPTTFSHVRWEWSIFPLLTFLLTIVLSVLSAVQSRNDVLYKSSILATLFHGLQEYPEDNVHATGLSDHDSETAAALLRKADGMRVVFKRNEKGHLKFLNVENGNGHSCDAGTKEHRESRRGRLRAIIGRFSPL